MRRGWPSGFKSGFPERFWVVLYSITVLGMMAVGYQTGIAASKRSTGQLNLAVSFALVFALIASLDRPDSGVLSVSQRPLADLPDAMAAWRASKRRADETSAQNHRICQAAPTVSKFWPKRTEAPRL